MYIHAHIQQQLIYLQSTETGRKAPDMHNQIEFNSYFAKWENDINRQNADGHAAPSEYSHFL